MARRSRSPEVPRFHWPVLTGYGQDELARVALPLGGIGTGTVSLGGRGQLHDWAWMNRPAKGFGGLSLFFLHARSEGRPAVTRVLEGLLEPPYEGPCGHPLRCAGLPRFRNCEFNAAYPLGQVLLSDPDVPLEVTMQAFNPLIPGNVPDSSLPVAIIRFCLQNRSPRAVTASICGAVENFIGWDGVADERRGNLIEPRKRGKLRGLLYTAPGLSNESPRWGEFVLATNGKKVTQQCCWSSADWAAGIWDFWHDFGANGRLSDRGPQEQRAPMGALSVQVEVPPRSEEVLTFYLVWRFPNRYSGGRLLGNSYCLTHPDAWELAVELNKRAVDLEAATLAFVDHFCHCDLAEEVKEAALYNLATLRSTTCWRDGHGRFWAADGSGDHDPLGHGNANHLWNYEHATAYLFPELARGLRRRELLEGQDADGRLHSRLPDPGQKLDSEVTADGHLAALMKLYREWQFSGDDEFLQELWPAARRALEWIWSPEGWDADRDGVLEGCQLNSLGLRCCGPHPLTQAWYLGALLAMSRMAGHLGHPSLATECRRLVRDGRRWTDNNLFNGNYYEQQIPDPKDLPDDWDPDQQLGPGCLTGQLAAQLFAHLCGLGYLLNKKKVRKTLVSIMNGNFQPDVYHHLNPRRAFALNEEAGLVTCAFPAGGRPERPPPCFSEVVPGLEYTTAAHMLCELQRRNGLRVIRAVRDRFDGRKRNPFAESEHGYHPIRSLAAWAAVATSTGFFYSGVTRRLTFKDTEGVFFWAASGAWGVVNLDREPQQTRVKLQVIYGALQLDAVEITNLGVHEFRATVSLLSGQSRSFAIGGEE